LERDEVGIDAMQMSGAKLNKIEVKEGIKN